MDENRVMDKLDRIAEDLSATRADVKNLYSYVQAVSGNQKHTADKLDLHERDVDAHGLKSVQKRDHRLIEWGTFLIAVIALFLSYHH